VIEVIFLWLKQQIQKILAITGHLLFHKVFSERESYFNGNKVTDSSISGLRGTKIIGRYGNVSEI